MFRTHSSLQVSYPERPIGLSLTCPRFERNQYLEVRGNWNGSNPEWAGKSAGDTYGAEHLCRLLGKS
jgi:mortality factor 4-like protein 1